MDAQIKEELIKLYLKLKDPSSANQEDLPDYKSFETLILIKYISDEIDSKILIKAEEKVNEYRKKNENEHFQTDYETMLIKYEKDIRGHVKNEQQLKLYSESQQLLIDQLTYEKNKLTDEINNCNKIIEEKNKIIEDFEEKIKKNSEKISLYEEKNAKLSINEKEYKSSLIKLEQKYKTEIEILKKKLKHFIDNSDFKHQNHEAILLCNTSRYQHKIISNYLLDLGNNAQSIQSSKKIYRNITNNIGNNYNNSVASSCPYENIEHYLKNKCPKSTNKETKIKSLKKEIKEGSTNQNIPLIKNNNYNNSFIINSKVQDEFINKLMVNDSLPVNTLNHTKSKKIFNRHKSSSNTNYKSIKNNQVNVIKKILLNAEKTDKAKGMANVLIDNNCNKNLGMKENLLKNLSNNASKEISINNIFGNKNNIGCNFVNNINIYSNNMKQEGGNNNNIFVAQNFKNFCGNISVKELLNNNNLLNNINYLHISKKQVVNHRNREKELGTFSISNSSKK